MFNECTKILTSGGVCSANLSFEEENEKLSNGSRAGDKAKTLPYSGSPSLLLKIMLKEPETKKAGKHVRIRTTITLLLHWRKGSCYTATSILAVGLVYNQ